MRTVRHILGFVLALVLLASALPAWAAPALQAAGAITYGETVQGKITEEAIEQPWTFTGAAGDVISILVARNDEDYLDATVKLQDPAGAVLIEVDDVFSLDPFYVTRLESDGEYTITVGRTGGEDGSSVGGYDLTLSQVDLTALATPVALSLAEGQQQTYFFVEAGEAQKVTLTYEISGGETRPDVVMSHFAYDDLWEETRYTELMTLSGSNVSSASVALELPADGIYLIVVQRGFFDWGDTSGEFVVTLSPAAE